MVARSSSRVVRITLNVLSAHEETLHDHLEMLEAAAAVTEFSTWAERIAATAPPAPLALSPSKDGSHPVVLREIEARTGAPRAG